MAIDPLPRSDVTAAPTEAEYRAFCDTVMATGRGRWFLAEYARRHRKASTQDALEALARIESRLHGSRSLDTAHVFEELRSLAATIHYARLDIGWSDSEFSKGAKVMALLELLEGRIGNLLDDGTTDASGTTPVIEDRTETRVQLTVISANPAPSRARGDLPVIDFASDAAIVTLPLPAPVADVATVEPPSQPAPVAVAAEPPVSTLAFTTVELFEPFEAVRPGAERTTVPSPVDFSTEPLDAVEFAPQTFEAPVGTPAPVEARTPPEAPAPQAMTDVADDAAPVVNVAPQRPPGYDPMTPVRALSEDERIALVS
ncbi:MAG: hypothetical protein AB7O50_16090 [Pseudolabrys sp.]